MTVPVGVQPPPLPAGGDRTSTEWDVRHGATNYLAMVGAQATSSCLAFATLSVTTRLLGPAGYGGVAAVLAAASLAGQMAVQWSAVSLIRYGCEEFVTTGRAATTFWTRFLVLLANLLILMGLSPWWLPPMARWLHLPARAYSLVAISLLTMAVWGHVQYGLQAVKLPRVQASLLAVERALVLLCVGALALLGKITWFTVAWAYAIAPVMMSAAGLWRLRALIFPGICLDRACLTQIMAFSVPLIPFSLVGSLFTNHLDAFFITRYLSVAALGIYAAAYQLAGTVMQLPQHAGTLLLPFFVTLRVNDQQDRVARFLREVLPVLTLLWSVSCVFGALLGGYLLPLAFGPRFHEAKRILWPLMAASAAAGPWLMGYAPASNARSATYIGTAAGILASLVNVTLDALLVPRFGLIGCAWGTVGAYEVMMLVGACFLSRLVPMSRSWVLQATMPAVLGASYMTWRGDSLGALAVGLVVTVLLGVWWRRAMTAGVRALVAAGLLEPVFRPMLRATGSWCYRR